MEVGVVIGRFQVDTLHEGHCFLIEHAIKTHQKVIVFLGCSPRPYSQGNPLDYPTREQMIRELFPTVTVMPLRDMASDDEWSQQVDDLIGVVAPYGKAIMYGGRDSFVPHYKGKHKAVEIDSPIAYQSGTQRRLELGKRVLGTQDFRAGSIYHSQNLPVRPIMGVDIALIKRESEQTFILLGRKTWDPQNKWRLPGGKVEVTDESLEMAARRELYEETGLTIEGSTSYLGSVKISDWRDKGHKDLTYLSALFSASYTHGASKVGSDLVELEWWELNCADNWVVSEHVALIDLVQEKEYAR